MQSKCKRVLAALHPRRTLLVCLCALAIVTVAVSGTLAWLVDTSNQVTNTFTYGDINLSLEETKTNENGEPLDANGDVIPEGATTAPQKTTSGNEYKMVPGKVFLKDPVVTVKANSEKCWLFVELTEKGRATVGGTNFTFDNYLTYAVADDWQPLAGQDGVYYRIVEMNEAPQDFAVLKNNRISVPDTVNKEMLLALDATGAEKVELSITAYAVQYLGFEADNDEPAAAQKAWETAKPQPPTNP